MRALILLPYVAMGLAACAGYPPDPLAEPCNIGGPLSKAERAAAAEPNPQAIPGRPYECRLGPDGVVRLSPEALARYRNPPLPGTPPR